MAIWMTIPEWSSVKQISVFHREQDEAPLPETGAPLNLHMLVRGQICLPEGSCVLKISADDYYHAYIDGQWLGCGPAPAYPEHYHFQTYSIPGGRTVTVGLHLYYQGLRNRVWNSGDGRFGVFLSATRDAQEIGCCDEGWRYQICHAYSGGVIGYDTQFLEDFDSRKWPEGWESPGFDDSGWNHLTPADWADYEMHPQPTQNLQWEEWKPAAVRPVPGGLLYDFGQEIVGLLAVSAHGKAGKRVTLRFGEELDDDGRVRYEMRCNCRCQEHWTLAEGANTLHPFDYKAFRYVELLPDPGVTLEKVTAWSRCYPMDPALCTLECSTDQLEDIFAICKNAVRFGTQESYLDCPSREKGQYLGDAILTARSQVWLTGKTDMLRKCIRNFLATAKISPGLMAVAPGSVMQEIGDFSLLFPLLPLTDYAFTGDKAFLKACYPTVKVMTEAFSVYAREDGLLENVAEQWNLVDWPEEMRDGYDFPLTRPIVGQGCHNVINALYYGALTMLEQMERILGLPVSWESKRVQKAFYAAFFRENQMLFADSEESSHCSLHSNLYPAFFGLLPETTWDAYENLLLTPGRHCGVFPAYFALKGLARIGRYETLYRLLTREDAYGWRNMLREGATACFEAWGKNQKWNTSLCHPWASGPISLIIEELAGFRPCPEAENGYRFNPHLPERVRRFDMTVPFRGNQYRIWRDESGKMNLERKNTHVESTNE